MVTLRLGCLLIGLGISLPGQSNQALPAAGKAATNHFDLPAQNLSAGLIEFALQANITIIVEDSLVANFNSKAVKGLLNHDIALTELLSNTPLGFTIQPRNNTYLIHPINNKAQTALGENLTTPMEEVVVTGYLNYPLRYTTVRNSQQKANVDYFDAVRFTNVIPEQLIADQQAEDFSEVLKYASGIMPGDGLADTNDDLYMRGFHRSAVFIDGFRVSGNTGIKFMPANIKQVEILKGPATVLYGQAEPGGTLNFIRHKPHDKNMARAQVAAGSLGKNRYSADLNFAHRSLQSRLIIAQQRQETSGDTGNINRELVSPAIHWQVTERAQIYLNLHRQHNYQQSKPVPQELTSNAGWEDFYREYPGRSPAFDSRFSLITSGYNFDFNDDWALGIDLGDLAEQRQGVRTSSDTLTNGDVLLKAQPVGETIIVMPLGGRIAVPIKTFKIGSREAFGVGPILGLYGETGSESAQQTTVHLNGRFTTGFMDHKLTAGLYRRQDKLLKRYISEINALYTGQEWNLTELDSIMESLGEWLFSPSRALGQLQLQSSDLSTQDKAVYLSDSITLHDNWILAIGGRHSDMRGDITYFNPQTYNPSTPDHTTAGTRFQLPHYSEFSSQLGLVYKPSARTSWYINYSEAVHANYRIDAPSAQNARPESSEQIEVGLKSLAFDGRILSSLGIYTISKHDISLIAPKPGALNSLSFYDQSVRGLDLDIAWQMSPNCDLLASAAWIDPRIDSGLQAGLRPADIAKQSAGLFTHYTFSPHWSADFGVHFIGARNSSRLGDKISARGQQVELPAYTTVDAHLNYQGTLNGHPTELKLSVKNATDELYYTANVAGVRPNIAEGRSVQGSIRLAY